MANYTPNISLKKPLPSDNVSLSDINTNYDKIDSEFGGVLLRVEQNEQDISTLQPCIMTVDLNTNNYALSSTSGALNFNHILSSVGDKLTNANGGIKIGAGVSKVKVSCNLWVNAEGQHRVWMMLNLNKASGETVRLANVISTDMGGFVSGSIAQFVVDVSPNDYFNITYSNAASGMGVNRASASVTTTNLTVEVIE